MYSDKKENYLPTISKERTTMIYQFMIFEYRRIHFYETHCLII